MTQRPAVPALTTLDRLQTACRQLTKASARLADGDLAAAATVDQALSVVAGIVKEIRTEALDPGHGGPLLDVAGEEQLVGRMKLG